MTERQGGGGGCVGGGGQSKDRGVVVCSNGCESSKLGRVLRKASAFAGLGKKAPFKEGRMWLLAMMEE